MAPDETLRDVGIRSAVESHQSETELIVRCLRALVFPDVAAWCGAHPGAGECDGDWDWILALSKQHRIEGFVAGTLARAGVMPQLAPAIRAAFDVEHARCSSICRARRKELEEVGTILARRAIAVIPLKGVALAASVYGERCPRQMGDVDILVPEASVQQAFELLVDAGFRRADPYVCRNRWHRAIYRETSPEWNDVEIGRIPLVRGDVEVDLHFAPRYWIEGGYVALDVGAFWQRARRAPHLGPNVHALAPADLLAHLIVHAADRHDRLLVHALDIAMVSRRQEVRWHDTPLRAMLPDGQRLHLDRFVDAIAELFDTEQPPVTLSSSTRSAFFTLDSPPAGQTPHGPPASDPLAIDGVRMFRRIRSRTQRLKFVLGYALPGDYYAEMSPVRAHLTHWRESIGKVLRLARSPWQPRRPQ